MADLNEVIVIGRVTKDEELKYTPGGMAIGNISIAVNRRVKKGQEWADEANFFDVVIFGKQAENLSKFLTKGQQIAIVGFLKQERWEDVQTGEKRSKIKIVTNNIQLLSRSKNNEQNNSYSDNGYYDYN